DQEAHLGSGRYHQRLIDLQQVVLTLGRQVVDLVARGGEIAEELHVLAQVLVVPLPLVTGDLDIDVGLGRVVDVDQRSSRRNRHADQDQQGNDRPEHLDLGVLVEVCRVQ